MRVLFCTDGSDISINTLNNASEFLKEAIVDIICVIDWSFLPSSMNIEHIEYSKAYENIAESVLTYAQKAIKENGLQVGDKIKMFGSPSEGILDQLKKEDYDMVLMGSYGKKGLQKWLGSVSRQVISATLVPAFVSKKKTLGKRVLLTTDGSEISIKAIKHALDLISLENKEIYIISIKENPEFYPMEVSTDHNWYDAIEKQQRIHATKAVNKIKSLVEEIGLKAQNEVILTGNPAQKIIDYSNQEEIDLIIMGARTKTDLSKLLLGSVSKRVLENVRSDVLIINK